MKQRVVIIGGGFGGLSAAKHLRKAPVEITLIDRRNHHLFQPLLYQVATGELSPADIATPLRRLLKRQKNARVLLGEVTRIDTANQRVRLDDGRQIAYDKLIVAAGAVSNYFGNDVWQDSAPGLKTMEDAIEIRRRILSAFEDAERLTDPDAIRAALTFVIIGGGPTGVELAGALAEIAHQTFKRGFHSIDPSAARIVLIHRRDRILPPYHADLSTAATTMLERMGVEVLTNADVIDVAVDGVTTRSDDRTSFIPSRTILWAVGVRGAPLGRVLSRATGAKMDRSGRIVVEPDLSVYGYPDIFVIGDLAHFDAGDDKPLPGLAQVAIQQGKYVARLISRRGRGISSFHYRDRGNMATIGRGAAVVEIGRLRFSGWLAWQMWLVIHLLYQIDLENRVLVFIQWLWNFFTGDRSALLIIDPEQPSRGAVEAKYATDTGTWPSVK